ncbi:hypothetical protein DAPPUDRAFT_329839 [Daphnia pulex]|uniref:Uncharacterized protein n=1 Tax=Daphnia pulex TaxID=6669 RepID=E9HHR9_DAPPU|nr:hypothetical protein DAPPUDRAFT_329839 [Daphnia pulex]|eukprot:EFX68717.1 hypothetical protein DAPPUDRAFT_329839 [Daphnia pulex]
MRCQEERKTEKVQVETKLKDSLNIPTGVSRPGTLTSKAATVKSKANTYKCKESRNSCSSTSVPAGLQVETKMKDSFDIEKLDIPTGLSRPGPLTSKTAKSLMQFNICTSWPSNGKKLKDSLDKPTGLSRSDTLTSKAAKVKRKANTYKGKESRNSCSLTYVPAGLQENAKLKDSLDIEKMDIPTGCHMSGKLILEAAKSKNMVFLPFVIPAVHHLNQLFPQTGFVTRELSKSGVYPTTMEELKCLFCAFGPLKRCIVYEHYEWYTLKRRLMTVCNDCFGSYGWVTVYHEVKMAESNASTSSEQQTGYSDSSNMVE